MFIQHHVAGKSSNLSHYAPTACNGTQRKVDIKRDERRVLCMKHATVFINIPKRACIAIMFVKKV